MKTYPNAFVCRLTDESNEEVAKLLFHTTAVGKFEPGNLSFYVKLGPIYFPQFENFSPLDSDIAQSIDWMIGVENRIKLLENLRKQARAFMQQ